MCEILKAEIEENWFLKSLDSATRVKQTYGQLLIQRMHLNK